MTTDIYLDPTTWDIVIKDGDIVFVPTAQELVRQVVVTTLRTFRGEWFMDTNYGVPWLENDNNEVSILGKTDKVFFDSTIRKAILGNKEVLAINSYENNFNRETGLSSFKVDVQSAFGSILVETSI